MGDRMAGRHGLACGPETKDVSRLPDRPGQTRREAGTQSQGSPETVGETARPPVSAMKVARDRGDDVKAMLANVKAMLAYLTWTLILLGAIALTVGAGIKWDWY